MAYSTVNRIDALAEYLHQSLTFGELGEHSAYPLATIRSIPRLLCSSKPSLDIAPSHLGVAYSAGPVRIR